MNNTIEFDDQYDRRLLNFLDAVEHSDIQQLLQDFKINNPDLFLEVKSAIIKIPTK